MRSALLLLALAAAAEGRKADYQGTGKLDKGTGTPRPPAPAPRPAAAAERVERTAAEAKNAYLEFKENRKRDRAEAEEDIMYAWWCEEKGHADTVTCLNHEMRELALKLRPDAESGEWSVGDEDREKLREMRKKIHDKRHEARDAQAGDRQMHHINEDFEMRNDFCDHKQFRDFALCTKWASGKLRNERKERLGNMIGRRRAGSNGS
ncbi:SET domain-containing protein [Aureococcus anophagefferens]|nr:SET domain-containing protein [Aureococcus anophagefferens]